MPRSAPTMTSGARSSRPQASNRNKTTPNPPKFSQLKVGKAKMSVNNKRVFYVKYLAHDIYTEIMKGRPDVRLDRLENDSPADVFTPILSAAHAYQVGAARDELARHFHVDKDFLKRTPNLLIFSSNTRGFATSFCRVCSA